MVGGQALDIGLAGPVTDLETLTRLHAGKTGALITAACTLGARAGAATDDVLGRIERYGRAVGLAFQLADDVLDADQDQGELGPPSFVRLLGVDETRRRAEALVTDAIAEVRSLPSPDRLLAIARFVIERSV